MRRLDTEATITLRNSDVAELGAADCLNEFVDAVVSMPYWTVECIILFGGLVRDGGIIDGWSDIDIIVAFDEIPSKHIRKLSVIARSIQAKYKLRLDIVAFGLNEIQDASLKDSFTHSGAINALAMRKNVSKVLYGSVPYVTFSKDHEKIAAVYYISSTMLMMRDYMINIATLDESEEHFRTIAPRITRWVFSIVRASLRLYGIYCHPYEESIAHVNSKFPDVDTTTLERLVVLRKTFVNCGVDMDLLMSAYEFSEAYSQMILRCHHENH